LAAQAVECVERAVGSGDARTAVAVLKGLGLLGTALPIGSDDPRELEWQCDEAAAREAQRRRLSELSIMAGPGFEKYLDSIVRPGRGG
jgi:hypothetical protein